MTEKNHSSEMFAVRVGNNPFRERSDEELSAVVVVELREPAPAGDRSVEAAEVILVDSSMSMEYIYRAGSPAERTDKLDVARRATQAAVRAIRDGVHFAVVAGAGECVMVYPPGEQLAVADETTRQAAVRAVQGIRSQAGTSIGKWLELADRLLGTRPRAIRHALMFTDGQSTEYPGTLERVLAGLGGRFTCDIRGIGVDYDPGQVLRIASALNGEADAVVDLADLETELPTLMNRSLDRTVGGVRLTIEPMTGTELRCLRQVHPSRKELTGDLTDPGPAGHRTLDTGAWGREQREYYLRLGVTPPVSFPGREAVAARVVVSWPGGPGEPERTARARIMVHWTDDSRRSVPVHPSVARAEDRAEMGEAIHRGLEALEAGNTAEAELRLGTAVRLAADSGDEESVRRLERVVQVDDAARGRVRIRSDADRHHLLSAAMRTLMSSSVELVRSDPPGPVPAQAPPGPAPVCVCGRRGRAGDRVCEGCGRSLGATP